MSDFKVDYFFPWVNPADEYWQAQYNKATGQKLSPSNPRFRDWGTLKYVFRGLDENAPWLNNIYLIVSNRTQLPNWLNFNTVKVIVHPDFIPSQYLPTFNSNTIEMFYGNLPCLSEHLIYGNDDLYFMNPTGVNDFFTEDGLPKIAFNVMNLATSDFLKTVKRTSDLIRLDFNSDYAAGLLPTSLHFLKQAHLCTPMLKSTIKQVYTKHQDNIFSSITQLRDNNKNYNQYMYTDYQILSGKFKNIKSKSMGSYLSFSDSTAVEIKNAILTSKSKILCVNDNGSANSSGIKATLKAFEEKFPDKCRFEK